MKRILLLLATCIATVACSSEQSLYPDLDKYLEILDENSKFMGSVSVSRGDTLIYSKAIGYSDLDEEIKATTESEYKIGSISKSFTAVLVMQAVEKGLLTLETTLDNYFPSIKNSEQITIEQMLRHRSGIANYFTGFTMSYYEEAKTRSVMVDTISIGSHKGEILEPDSISSYSNSNYVLLTYILEDIHNEKFSEILKTNIVEPLGLKNTSMPDSQQGCWSYLFSSNEWGVVPETHPSAILGAGGIVSTPTDLNTFYYALFNGKLLSEKSLNQMMDTEKEGMPLGIGLLKMPHGKMVGYGHSGGIDGYISFAVYYPEDRISISITSNGVNYDFNYIYYIILRSIYDKPIENPQFDTITLAEEDLDKYLGVYVCDLSPVKIDVTKSGNILVIQGTGQPSYGLAAVKEHTFEMFFLGQKIEVIFHPENKTLTYRMAGLVFEYTNEKNINAQAEKIILSEEDLDVYLGTYTTTQLPIKISITKKGNILVGQGTGQPSFNLVATEEYTFAFAGGGGIVLVFDLEKKIMTLKQRGKEYEMKKE